ncbi:signal peptidase I [Thermosporothrix hazakensis]|uniref:Signal peptidase I n=2 Tax=Thermosporothrix TaxID=768650 RepID=A0A326U8K4_THEHA|nr:signal peptidase I [Thermosporothrix hazakensis]PZW20811.1 signal peptidase I [Thermosporothrix hazakensis]BBH89352.1 signal peptidase I [Thermosporothrix sp. COM3]GCE47534.1 signal peptidase I [Thermosporothrix hazakensis]
MKRSHLLREIVEILALALLIFLVVRLVVQSYHVDGDSMSPSLQSNQNVLVNKMAYLFRGPERGDVIVFHYPKEPNVDYIKRIIGVPGDTIRIDSEHVWVNDVQLNEPYIKEAINPYAKSWKVPADNYFVLGDNRPVSKDSRYWDFVPKEYIVGKAVLVYWPTDQWKFIDTYSNTFAPITTKQ